METGDVRTTTSNETGNYIFPLVDSGTYEVSATASGFKTELRRSIPAGTESEGRIDFQMQVGPASGNVEVSSAMPLLKTEDATLGSVIEQQAHRRAAAERPQLRAGGHADAGRGLRFGAHGIDGQQTIGTRAMPGQIVGLSANGQRDANQNITLDGVSARMDSSRPCCLSRPWRRSRSSRFRARFIRPNTA